MSDFWVGPAAAPDTYRLVSLLGGGGEGEVWKAVLPLSAGGRRFVAIKITRSQEGADAERWEQFGHLLRSLSHPGLVRVTDVFLGPSMHREGEAPPSDAPLRYAVMDYIDGTNLREWAAENPEATASQRLRMLGMVAAALDEMHSGASTEVAVAHGDVKPANIVVRSDGAAILVDLGLARLADAGGVPGRSAAYAAPELRVKGALATPEADRYAFAVTTAQLLTGQAPPVGNDGWLDPRALRELLTASPLTARRHLLVQRIMTMISSPPEARSTRLRPWLDGAVESLSQATNTSLPATPPPPPEPVAGPDDDGLTSGQSNPPPADTGGNKTRSEVGEPEEPGQQPESEPPGERFGPYRLEELIGRGGMGEVYRATDTSRNRVVALKRLPAAMADDPEFQARFRDESALAARLNEPHIIPIHDFGEIGGRLFIDMRLVEGTDLAQLLADTGALAPARAVRIVRQVASALDAAHAAGLVHRDVKPANVLLRTDGTNTATDTDLDDGPDFAYLVDFGIARATNSVGLTGTGGAIGSVIYMAPERFEGHSDHRSDIYSLGCLLFEALTGQRPFPAEDTAAAVHAHLSLAPPRPSEVNPTVPAALDAVIATAMAKHPDQRYASAGALAAAARNALALADGVTVPDAANANTAHITAPGPEGRWYGQGPTVPIGLPDHQRGGTSASAAPAIARPTRQRVLWASIAAVFVLLIAGTGGYFALTSSPPKEPTRTARPVNPVPNVLQEPIQTPGTNPFMPSAGTDVPNVEQPPEARGAYAGSTPGLYGGTLNNAECDRPTMISFLQINPDKAAAWAAVQNITPDAVPNYINQLTPVILRGDTAVTNHGFANGAATTLQSVLQAGSAVLIDSFGVPRARCACGNPLTPPEQPSNAEYDQPGWPRFNPSNVLATQPHTQPIAEFTLTNLADGTPLYRPAGTAGERDHTAPLPAPPATLPAPAAKPQPAQPPNPSTPAPCPTGQTRNDAGICAPKPCPADHHSENGKCVPNGPSCTGGKVPSNGECRCPDGTMNQGDTCRRCPKGTYPEGGVCHKIPAPTPKQKCDNGQAVGSCECPANVIQGRCYYGKNNTPSSNNNNNNNSNNSSNNEGVGRTRDRDNGDN